MAQARAAMINAVSIHTPTQGVTRIMFIIKTGIEYVSIHTPTQGVTLANLYAQGSLTVSIHTPTQGVTISTFDWRGY